MSDILVIDLLAWLIITYKEMCEVNEDLDYKFGSVQLITCYFYTVDIDNIKSSKKVKSNLTVINDIDENFD